jgi:hypothetical protein
VGESRMRVVSGPRSTALTLAPASKLSLGLARRAL